MYLFDFKFMSAEENSCVPALPPLQPASMFLALSFTSAGKSTLSIN